MKQYNNVLPLISIIIPVIFSLPILLLKNKYRTIEKIIFFLGILTSFACLVYLIKPVIYENKIIIFWFGGIAPINKWVFGQGIQVDAFSLLCALIVSVILLVNSIYSFGLMRKYNLDEKMDILSLLLMSSLFGVFFASDLFSVYFFIEIMCLILAILMVFDKGSSKTYISALKLLLINNISSLFILLGTVLLYVQVHTLNIAQISALLFSNYKEISIYSFAMLFIGYAAKSFVFPLVSANIYSSAKALIPVTVCISIISVIAGFYGVIRLLYFMFFSKGLWNFGKLLIVAGIAIAILCILLAIIQKMLLRAIIYLLASHVGIIVTVIGLGLSSHDNISVPAVNAFLNSITAYVIFAALLLYSTGSIICGSNTGEISKMGNLCRRMPITFITFFTGTLSMIGVPFLAGFNPKWSVINIMNDAGYSLISKILLLYSVVLIVYFFILIEKIFFGKNSVKGDNVNEVSYLMYIPALIMAAASVIVGLKLEKVIADLIFKGMYSIFNLGGYIDSVFGKGYVTDMLKTEYKMPTLKYDFNSFYKIVGWNKYIIIVAFIILLLLHSKLIVKLLTMIWDKLKRIQKVSKFDSFVKENNMKIVKVLITKLKIQSRIEKRRRIDSISNLQIFQKIINKTKSAYIFLISGELSINAAAVCLLTCMSFMIIYTFYTLL